MSAILRLKKRKKVPTAIKLGRGGGGNALMARPLTKEFFLRLPLMNETIDIHKFC